MTFKIFSSYVQSSVGFDKSGKKSLIKTKVPKRINDVLIDLYHAYTGISKEDIKVDPLAEKRSISSTETFEFSAQSGNLDMFAKVYRILENLIGEEKLSLKAKRILLQGKDEMYPTLEMVGIIAEDAHFPSLEVLTRRIIREN